MEKAVDIFKISQEIVNLIEDHFIVCDLDGEILFSNKSIQSYLGYSNKELIGKNFLDIISDNNINKARTFLSSANEKISNYEELIFKTKSGSLILNVRHFQKDKYIYIFGNEKYIEYGRLKNKLDIEIANAIKIHKQSLPGELPNTENLSFASLYIPAQELGGDIYDVFKVDNGLLNDYFDQYVCFIADVSGHGLDSAMLAIFVKDTIRSYFRHKHVHGQVLSPKKIMEFFTEEYIKQNYPPEYLVCIFFLVIDLKTNELTYCNAGFHMSPLLIDKGKIIELNKSGLPVSTAIDKDLYNYREHSIDLSSHMTMFFMSDGLIEQRSNNETYENRFKNLAAKVYRMPSSTIVDQVHKDFLDFVDYNNIVDDITLVVMRLYNK